MTRPDLDARVAAAVIAAGALLASCANRPDSIHASYVSHEKYMQLDCSSMAARLDNTRAELERNSQIQNDKANGDAVGVFLFGVPFSKLSGDVEGEIARLKGEIEAIDTAQIKKMCGSPAGQYAASAAGVREAALTAKQTPAARPSGGTSTELVDQRAPEWVGINNADELRAIYSDTTIKGTAYLGKAQRATPFVGHFRSDGTGVLAINGQRIPRLWEVVGNDQVCATDAKAKNCYRLQRNRNNRNEIKGWNVTSNTTIEFTIEGGVTSRPEAVQAPVIRASAISAESRLSQTSQPVALLHGAAESPDQLHGGKLPAPGTTWVYRFNDRIWGRSRTDVTVRVVSSDIAGIQEAVSTNVAGIGPNTRVVAVRDPHILKLPLGGSAILIEVAPYLPVADEDGAMLRSSPITGYPQGAQGLPSWSIRAASRGWQQITVPAGSYRALRFEITGKREPGAGAMWGQSGRFSILAWYAPEVKRLAKLEHKTWELFSGKLNGHDVVELLAFRPPS